MKYLKKKRKKKEKRKKVNLVLQMNRMSLSVLESYDRVIFPRENNQLIIEEKIRRKQQEVGFERVILSEHK